MAASGGAYEGERNAAGQPEGYGTMRWADGDVYEGQWKGGKLEGRGTYRTANGRVEVGFYKADARVGEGVRWSADGQTAWRLRDGKKVEEISLEEARRVVAEHGLPLPEEMSGAGSSA